MTSRISTDEKRWRAESDARALADAIEIQGDPARLATAKPAPKSPAKPAPRKGK